MSKVIALSHLSFAATVLVTSLSAVLASNAAEASPNARQGRVSGACVISSVQAPGKRRFTFDVGPGEKVELGFLVAPLGEGESPTNVFSVEVGNDIGTSFQKDFGGFVLGFARPPETYVFRNPPVLCPTSPEDAREQCLRENPPQLPLPAARTDVFHLVKDGHGPSDVVLPMIWLETVADGFKTTLTHDFGFTTVTCEARFASGSGAFGDRALQ